MYTNVNLYLMLLCYIYTRLIIVHLSLYENMYNGLKLKGTFFFIDSVILNPKLYYGPRIRPYSDTIFPRKLHCWSPRYLDSSSLTTKVVSSNHHQDPHPLSTQTKISSGYTTCFTQFENNKTTTNSTLVEIRWRGIGDRKKKVDSVFYVRVVSVHYRLLFSNCGIR